MGDPRDVWEDTSIRPASNPTTLTACLPFSPISSPTLLLYTPTVLSLSLGKERRAEAGASSQPPRSENDRAHLQEMSHPHGPFTLNAMPRTPAAPAGATKPAEGFVDEGSAKGHHHVGGSRWCPQD